MQTEIKTPKFEIPANILAENHRKAYAAAFVAAFTGKKLAFVAPVVRHSICRGWFAGEQARTNWDKFTGPQFHNGKAAAAVAVPF